MKRLLILLMTMPAVATFVNAQQGYQWTFGTTPYKAVGVNAASVANAPNYTLSTIGSGSSFIVGSEVVGVGPSCNTGIAVTQYRKPYGFQLNQNPQFIVSHIPWSWC